MELGRIITGCLVGLITIALGIYVSFTARKKGPILSNTYIWLSKKEQEKADRNAEYKLVTIIFSGLAIAFLFLTIYIFTFWKWMFVFMCISIVFVMIYAILDSIKTNKIKNNKNKA